MNLLVETLLSFLLLLSNSFVFVAIISSRILRKNSTFILISALFFLDILALLITLTYSIPSAFIGWILYGNKSPTTIQKAYKKHLGSPYDLWLVVALSFMWFGSILLLPTVALFNAIANYFLIQFRNLKTNHSKAILSIAVLISLFLSVPLFFSCCGFRFYLHGHFWAFDHSKKTTFIYQNFNLGLQVNLD
ncbi:hypothetical protein L596_011167 [Steinernema carpocapsae]|uniref:G-protein coupled receptors family 1 profile domain-containing protein n=1 Tax=Steinernema carpocapsae TaxID=34508 RepID=A0A4U5NSV2_STECR|nr:hypothetical protein L596_011167 [Steinernema carpocapsae]